MPCIDLNIPDSWHYELRLSSVAEGRTIEEEALVAIANHLAAIGSEGGKLSPSADWREKRRRDIPKKILGVCERMNGATEGVLINRIRGQSPEDIISAANALVGDGRLLAEKVTWGGRHTVRYFTVKQ